MGCKGDLTLEETELRLGLLGNEEPKRETTPSAKINKRCCLEMSSQESIMSSDGNNDNDDCAPPAKVQIVGWPPVRSYRKNSLQQAKKNESDGVGMYVKVSMHGAPYLRKINLKVYTGYPELLQALETMFKFTIAEYSKSEGYNGSEYMPTYEDKDGDWMLVGDVPWTMFISACKRLRVMKASEARGLGCL